MAIYFKLNCDFTLFFCFLIFFTIFSDIGAYIFGNLIGGKKLLEKVSPKKTISGALGGVVFPLLFCFIFFNDFASSWILILYRLHFDFSRLIFILEITGYCIWLLLVHLLLLFISMMLVRFIYILKRQLTI